MMKGGLDTSTQTALSETNTSVCIVANLEAGYQALPSASAAGAALWMIRAAAAELTLLTSIVISDELARPAASAPLKASGRVT